MPGSRHICLITSGHLCSNPRLVKEAIACHNAGFQISIISCQFLPKLVPFDLKLKEEHPEWNIHFIDSTGMGLTGRLFYAWSAVRYSLGKLLWNYTGTGSKYAINRLYMESLDLAGRTDADLYIAHNLAALPVAARAAKLNSKKYAFDAEDFHRGEYERGDPLKILISTIEEKFMPGAAYLTAASPLIGKAYETAFPGLKFHTINNVFSLRQQPPFQEIPQAELELFWFSQTVGRNRGIQDVLLAMQSLQDLPIRLTLLGNCTPEDKNYFLDFLQSPCHQLRCIDTVSEDDLISIAASHHIGLALEPGFSENNNIALSNKIFTYLLAGNAIIASRTEAQELFMSNNPEVGYSYGIGNITKLAKIICRCAEDRKNLLTIRRNAWQLARDRYNWENEQKKFLRLVN